ncbi:MAG: methyltransferase domain-containing protein, partial [Paracoccaceae bacterium]|nr:methyltransferase domain-containing protein [Paracoccaceae bacterium]
IFENCSNSTLGSILDLGCGTGLTGIALKQFSQKIEGIDLSNSMIEQARKKNVYDKLTHCDIIDYLSVEKLDFDYFIATDVFIYVGDLSEVFRLIKARNKRSGKLVFSTEHTERERFFLEETGRYSHSKIYIQRLCEEFDYKLSSFATTDLRKEKEIFLKGGLYLLDF